MSKISEPFDVNSPKSFGIFIGFCVLVVMLFVFYLFYFQHLLALVLARLCRLYSWNVHQIYLDFDSIQFSLFSGRIFFKKLVYYGQNQCIRVHQGHVVIRYWLLNPRSWRDASASDDAFNNQKKKKCRIGIFVEGLDWYVYNRDATYTTLEQVLTGRPSSSNPASTPISEIASKESVQQYLDTSLVAKFFPIEFAVTVGRVTLGNTDLPVMLSASFESVRGEYAIAKARSTLDYYRNVITATFVKLKADFDENTSYKDPELQLVALQREREQQAGESWFRRFRRNISTWSTRNASLYQNSVPAEVALPPWRGLPRYRTASAELAQGAGALDALSRKAYEPHPTAVVCDEITVEYYADTVGPARIDVPRRTRSEHSIHLSSVDIGNGDTDPEWGYRIKARNSVINYGPWENRQRAILQDFFFPPSYRDAEITRPLELGQNRYFTNINLSVELVDGAILRLPMREPSKDWRFTDASEIVAFFCKHEFQRRCREYGWVELKSQEPVRVDVSVPMVVAHAGYSIAVAMDAPSPFISTSVSNAPFVEVGHLKVSCDLHTPCVWNAERRWTFDVVLCSPVIFLSRPHLFLVQDLIRDWTSGPVASVDHFVPTEYLCRVKLGDFVVHVNINDQHVVDVPNAFNANTFMSFSGVNAQFNVLLSSLKIQPPFESIKFDMKERRLAPGILEISLSLQEGNTIGAFLALRDRTFTEAESIDLDGRYDYQAVVSPDSIESLMLNVQGNGISIKAYGFIVRYLLLLRDNLFGSRIYPVTSSDFAASPRACANFVLHELLRKPVQNALTIDLTATLDDCVILFPERLYSTNRCFLGHIDTIQLDMRNTESSLDLVINASSLLVTREVYMDAAQSVDSAAASEYDSPEFLQITGVSAHASRLFGPPPQASTYVCYWELLADALSLRAYPAFLEGLLQAAIIFDFHLDDHENTFILDLLPLVDSDVTFVHGAVKDVDVTILGETACMVVLLMERGFDILSNNLVNELYWKKIIVDVPSATLLALYPDKGSGDVWKEAAFANLPLSCGILFQASDWRKRLQLQRAFVLEQDSASQRCSGFYSTDDITSSSGKSCPPSSLGIANGNLPFRFMPVQQVLYNEFRRLSSPAASDCRVHGEGKRTARSYRVMTSESPSSPYRAKSKIRLMPMQQDRLADPCAVMLSEDRPFHESANDLPVFFEDVEDLSVVKFISLRIGPCAQLAITPALLDVCRGYVSMAASEGLDDRQLIDKLRMDLVKSLVVPSRIDHTSLCITVPAFELYALDADHSTGPDADGCIATQLVQISFDALRITGRLSSVPGHYSRVLTPQYINLSTDRIHVIYPAVDHLSTATPPDISVICHQITFNGELRTDAATASTGLQAIELSVNAEQLAIVAKFMNKMAEELSFLRDILADMRDIRQLSVFNAVYRCIQSGESRAGRQISTPFQHSLRKDVDFIAMNRVYEQAKESESPGFDDLVDATKGVQQLLGEWVANIAVQYPEATRSSSLSRMASLLGIAGEQLHEKVAESPPFDASFLLGQLVLDVGLQGSRNVLQIGTLCVAAQGEQVLRDAADIRLQLAVKLVDVAVKPSLLDVAAIVSDIMATDRYEAAASSNHSRSHSIAMAKIPVIVATATAEAIHVRAQVEDVELDIVSRTFAMMIQHLKAGSGDDHQLVVSASLPSLRLLLHESETEIRPRCALLQFDMLGSCASATLALKNDARIHRWSVSAVLPRVALRVPQSLVNLYAFVKKWSSGRLEKYGPVLQALRRDATDREAPRTTSSGDLHILIQSVSIRCELLRTLLVEYAISDALVTLREENSSKTQTSTAVQIQLRKQSISTIPHSSQNSTETELPSTFTFPSARSTLLIRSQTAGDALVTGSIFVDRIRLNFNVSMLDQFLAAQNLVSSDVKELVDLFVERRQSDVSVRKPRDKSAPMVSISSVLGGFQVAALSPTAVLFVESDLISGFLYSDASRRQWRATGKGLSASCNHNASMFESRIGQDPNRFKFDSQRFRLAHVRADVDVVGSHNRSTDQGASQISAAVADVYAVMQPVASGKIIDIVMHYIRELESRKRERAQEIADLQESTSKILHSLNADIPRYQEVGVKFVSSRNIKIIFARVSVVIPLAKTWDSSAISAQRDKSALMISLTEAAFLSRQANQSSASLNSFRCQFIDSFNPAAVQCFDPDFHRSRDTILLPSLTVEAITPSFGESVQITLDAVISGFLVNISPMIVDYTAAFLSVWQYSRQRFEVLSNVQSSSPGDKSNGSALSTVPVHANANLSFETGILRLHVDPSGSSKPVDVSIPGLTSAIVANVGPPTDAGNGNMAHVEIVVLRSENTIETTVMDFVLDLAQGFTTLFSTTNSTEVAAGEDIADTSAKGMTIQSDSPLSQLKLSIYFRLSSTCIRLSCAPPSPVVCLLRWDNGDFILTTNPMRREFLISASGVISGAGVQVQHSYSPDPCMIAEVENIALNGSFLVRPPASNILSILVHVPKVSGSLNMRLWQDLLVFKYAWIDRSIRRLTPVKQSAPVAKLPPSPPGALRLLSRATFSEVDVYVDLVQKIGKVNVKLLDAAAEASFIPSEVLSSSVSVHSLVLSSNGRLQGEALVDSFAASGIAQLKTHRSRAVAKLDAISIYCMHEYQSLALVNMKEIFAAVGDFRENTPGLSVDVFLSSLDAIGTTRTLPIVMMLASIISKSIAEKEEAAGQLFDLSKSASATDDKGDWESLQEVVVAPSVNMRANITVNSFKASVHPARFADPDCAQGIIRQVHIQLTRTPSEDMVVHELQLDCDTVTLLRSTHKRVGGSAEKEQSAADWLERANKCSSTRIAALPFCQIVAISKLRDKDASARLEFRSNFTGRVEIPLNYALIRYLQELVAMYYSYAESLELDVQAIFQQPSKPQREIKYEIVEPVVFDPKLRYVGDVTPPIEWLGLQRERIPVIVYEAVTIPLEEVLAVLESVYVSKYRAYYL